MAGSWNHMITKSGKFRNNKTFSGMIENGGDAYEAAEECYGMVQWLADQLAAVAVRGIGSGDRQFWIKQAREHYEDGLRLGGVQRS